jgi:hypothetical protein
MSAHNKLRKHLYSSVGPVLLVAMSLATSDSGQAGAVCQGPGAPNNTQTKCLTAVQIPGNPLRSFDISWVNPDRAEMYFADRSNAAVQVIDTQSLTWKRSLPGFVGITLNPPGIPPGTVNNNLSGPDGVTSHGRWLYAGDGNSDLRVYDLNAPPANAFKQKVNTGGKTRLDEMALTTDGKLLIAANNAEDPPFATLFRANGDDATSHVSIITKITIDNNIVPMGKGLSIEQPAWDPKTKRFYTSIPQIANNPSGCTFDGSGGHPQCEGGMLVTDPTALSAPTAVQGAFNPNTNTGVVPLNACGPNGATVGPHDNLLLGCNPGNVADNVTTLVINAKTKNYANIGLITGADEVWFNKGDNRYYLGASKNCKDFSQGPCPTAAQQAAVLGVIDGTSVLIETIPQSSNSHSVAADSKRNRIFLPQVAPVATVGAGGDTTAVGAGICGGTNGCVAVYQHKVDDDDHEGDDDHKGDNDHQGDHDR